MHATQLLKASSWSNNRADPEQDLWLKPWVPLRPLAPAPSVLQPELHAEVAGVHRAVGGEGRPSGERFAVAEI